MRNEEKEIGVRGGRQHEVSAVRGVGGEGHCGDVQNQRRNKWAHGASRANGEVAEEEEKEKKDDKEDIDEESITY